jgi:hypothetical protein
VNSRRLENSTMITFLSNGADVWSEVLYKTEEAMKTMVERCESDVIGLEGLYKRTRHLYRDIKRD